MTSAWIDLLRNSSEPSVRYLVSLGVDGLEPISAQAAALSEYVRASPRVATLLSERDTNGELPHHPYHKWLGAHWLLTTLALLGYPPGDGSLLPLARQSLTWLLGQSRLEHLKKRQGKLPSERTRFCASMEGNALYYLLMLELPDERIEQLVDRLVRHQWQDGGWNCDIRPQADTSSFHETITPMRVLALYARRSGDPATARAVERAAEVFLSRRLFRRRSDGLVIDQHFTRLHFPWYWHYDILHGLKVMQEAGFLPDARCREALDLLESQQLPGGGFPAQGRFYSTSMKAASGRSLVGWGVTGSTTMNPFVSAQAAGVLSAAGRL